VNQRTCTIPRCPDLVHARDWCKAHYTRWRRHGDPLGGRHNYALDDGYFDSIDTEGKAYWLGFITADGCVQTGTVGANGWLRNQLSVKLKESDAGHLEKLKSALSAESPVRLVPQATLSSGAAEIAVTSGRLVESLISLGVGPRKSLSVQPWIGPDELMRHYWRGMVDGDGTLVVKRWVGHTPGSQMMTVRLKNKGLTILTGDNVYFKENVEKNLPPSIGLAYSPNGILTAYEWIRYEMATEKADFFTAHDPDAFKAMKKAPEFYD